MSGSGISWAICKQSAPRSRQIATPAPHRSVFYGPDALPAAQPTASKHWRHKSQNIHKIQENYGDTKKGMDLISHNSKHYLPLNWQHADYLFWVQAEIKTCLFLHACSQQEALQTPLKRCYVNWHFQLPKISKQTLSTNRDSLSGNVFHSCRWLWLADDTWFPHYWSAHHSDCILTTTTA